MYYAVKRGNDVRIFDDFESIFKYNDPNCTIWEEYENYIDAFYSYVKYPHISDSSKYVAYVDGSYDYTNNLFKFAFLIINNGKIIYQYRGIETKDQKMFKGVNNSTYTEMRAIYEAVNYAIKQNIKLDICTDCLGLINLLATKKSLVKTDKKLFRDFMVNNEDYYKLYHIKAHSKEPFNTYVDFYTKDENSDKRFSVFNKEFFESLIISGGRDEILR